LWRKSTRCESNACVEVASLGESVAMRDSKRTDGPVLVFTAQAWHDFLAAARDGEFDLPDPVGEGR
jgi:hypothetical protein